MQIDGMSREAGREAEVIGIYQTLLRSFGPQGWWPMGGKYLDKSGKAVKPGDGFSPPEWEVCIGAILTQNTSWKNVEKALVLLKQNGMTSPKRVAEAGASELERSVRPSGFYRQKAERLKVFADFVLGFGGFRGFSGKVTREQLLKVRGIGPETADSIMLYALDRPVFVVDAYTRRVFMRLGFGDKGGYEEWRQFFESSMLHDTSVYSEYHALIVELAKRHCRKKPVCHGCPLEKMCGKII